MLDYVVGSWLIKYQIVGDLIVVVPTLIDMDRIEDMDINEKGPGKNKRKWTDAEDKELVYALFDTVNAGTHKVDNEFKPGFLGVLDAVLKQKLPRSVITAKPHIDSRIKTMKKDFCVVYDMLNGENCNGFGWDPHKNVVVAEDEVWNAYVKVLSFKNQFIMYPICNALH